MTSLVLVVWQYFGMSIALTVVPGISSSLPPIMHSDELNGGLSRSSLTWQDDQVHLDCSIIHSETFAFCGVTLPLVEAGAKGINTQRYSDMQIELDYQSDEFDSVLFYLVHEELLADGQRVEKANLWAAMANPGTNRYSLDPDRFFIPSWWIFQNREAGVNLKPDISNTVGVRVTTGDNNLERDVQITISRITFSGKWIEADDLYLYLLIAWLALLSGHGLVYIQSLARKYRQSKDENNRLMRLNEFLNLQRDEFETMAKTDKLTGTWNRAGVRDLLREVTQRYRKELVPCSLISLDIDRFKEVNDEFGHDIGDNVLMGIAALITANTREKDKLARWGGEEFQIICPGTNKKDAAGLAESLRARIEKAELIESRSITCSFGVAGLADEETSEWFKRADQALYKAKHSGRNCVVTA